MRKSVVTYQRRLQFFIRIFLHTESRRRRRRCIKSRPERRCLFVRARGGAHARGVLVFSGWKNRRKTEQFVSATVGSAGLRHGGHKSARSSLKYGDAGDIWIWARRSEQEPATELKGWREAAGGGEGGGRERARGSRKSRRSVVKMSSPRRQWG